MVFHRLTFYPAGNRLTEKTMQVTRREMIHMLAAAATAEGLELDRPIATAEQFSSVQQTAKADWRNIVHGSADSPREL